MNQFPPNIIKAIRQYKRIQKKKCRQKMSIPFNAIYINEEMFLKCTYYKRHDPAEYRRDLAKKKITF